MIFYFLKSNSFTHQISCNTSFQADSKIKHKKKFSKKKRALDYSLVEMQDDPLESGEVNTGHLLQIILIAAQAVRYFRTAWARNQRYCEFNLNREKVSVVTCLFCGSHFFIHLSFSNRIQLLMAIV